jgi:FtsH-binding integral membrane protein
MTLGLGITGLVALLVASSPAFMSLLLGSPFLFYGLLIAQFAIVIAFTAASTRVSTSAAVAMFLGYAALTGVTFSTIFLVYTAASIASTFFISAGAFAGLSAVGYFTKRDLSTVGRFAWFALIGLIIASVVNFFLHSTGLMWLVSIGGVFVFGALTAYDTQKLKNLFAEGGAHANLPVVGALTLYLDFINMFLFLLRLFGRRRD